MHSTHQEFASAFEYQGPVVDVYPPVIKPSFQQLMAARRRLKLFCSRRKTDTGDCRKPAGKSRKR